VIEISYFLSPNTFCNSPSFYKGQKIEFDKVKRIATGRLRAGDPALFVNSKDCRYGYTCEQNLLVSSKVAFVY
jgi:hypothetical protein